MSEVEDSNAWEDAAVLTADDRIRARVRLALDSLAPSPQDVVWDELKKMPKLPPTSPLISIAERAVAGLRDGSKSMIHVEAITEKVARPEGYEPGASIMVLVIYTPKVPRS